MEPETPNGQQAVVVVGTLLVSECPTDNRQWSLLRRCWCQKNSMDNRQWSLRRGWFQKHPTDSRQWSLLGRCWCQKHPTNNRQWSLLGRGCCRRHQRTTGSCHCWGMIDVRSNPTNNRQWLLFRRGWCQKHPTDNRQGALLVSKTPNGQQAVVVVGAWSLSEAPTDNWQRSFLGHGLCQKQPIDTPAVVVIWV